MTDDTTVFCDWAANSGRRRIQIALLLLRIAQRARKSCFSPVAKILGFVYRQYSLTYIGFDIPVQTEIGAGLEIHHGIGLVVNGHASLGRNVCLRQNTTIGSRYRNDDAPNIEADVQVGAHSLVFGAVTIGRAAHVGAGSVVMTTVDPGNVVAGNPAKVISRGGSTDVLVAGKHKGNQSRSDSDGE
ncbi:serine O-acetyltransferase [Rhodococcus koreensis]|uniref:serine O-acetyltransferase n=1 Tax=Rhodococcus koreensis TaxID=99653 RepID=UPI003672E2A8